MRVRFTVLLFALLLAVAMPAHAGDGDGGHSLVDSLLEFFVELVEDKAIEPPVDGEPESGEPPDPTTNAGPYINPTG